MPTCKRCGGELGSGDNIRVCKKCGAEHKLKHNEWELECKGGEICETEQ